MQKISEVIHMSTTFTEADYENSIIELFQNMGYQYVYGPDIERDFYSPLYKDVLMEYIHRLNPSLPEEVTNYKQSSVFLGFYGL